MRDPLEGWPARPLREEEIMAIADLDRVEIVRPVFLATGVGPDGQHTTGTVALTIVTSDWYGAADLGPGGWGSAFRERRQDGDDAEAVARRARTRFEALLAEEGREMVEGDG